MQQTIAKAVTYTGIGLHSGKDVTVSLLPAPPDTGIVFIRVDLPGQPRVKAWAGNVTQTMRATTLEEGPAKVFTVEHLLAACYAVRLDNCLVEINSVEPPVADGSSLTFIELIRSAGLVRQDRPARVYEMKQSFTVRYPDKFITILPYDGFRITFTSLHPQIGIQFGDYEITPEIFLREIASARTIGFMHEIAEMQAKGLALGGSPENAVLYDGGKAINPLRFPDELVRHKILDVVGDLSLVGQRLRGHVVAVKSGHELNTALARKIILSANTDEEVVR